MTNTAPTEDIVRALAATPGTLRDIVAHVGDDLDRKPAGTEWSVLDIIHHLRASDAIIAPRVFHVLVRDDAPLPGFDERRWAELISAVDVPLRARLTEFGVRRAELAAVLRALPAEQWERAGEHEVRGRLTLRELCEGIVEHEGEHVAQLEMIVASFAET